MTAYQIKGSSGVIRKTGAVPGPGTAAASIAPYQIKGSSGVIRKAGGGSGAAAASIALIPGAQSIPPEPPGQSILIHEIEMPVVLLDQGGMTGIVPNRIVVPRDGIYLVWATYEFHISTASVPPYSRWMDIFLFPFAVPGTYPGVAGPSWSERERYVVGDIAAGGDLGSASITAGFNVSPRNLLVMWYLKANAPVWLAASGNDSFFPFPLTFNRGQLNVVEITQDWTWPVS